MTNLQAIQVAAVTTFGPMNSNDFAAFADAPAGTLIGFTGAYAVLQTPDGLFEVYGNDCEECYSFKVEQIL